MRSRVHCAESRCLLDDGRHARDLGDPRQGPPQPLTGSFKVRKRSVKPPRREPTERIAPWVEYLSATSAEEAFCECYRRVIERAEADGDWADGSARLTPAQLNALSMVQLWEQALATLKAWERSVPWATEEGVIEDCHEFIEFVGRAASEIPPPVLH